MQHTRKKIGNNLINIVVVKSLNSSFVKEINSSLSKEDILVLVTNQNINQKMINNFDKINCNKYFVLNKNHLKKAALLKTQNDVNIISWIEKQFVFASFIFDNYSQVTIMQGGISSEMKRWEDLDNNIDICFVENGWDHIYDGRFGYIVSFDDLNKKDKVLNLNKFNCVINTNSKYKAFLQKFSTQGLIDILYI